jgi:hypothetical protein
MSEPTEPPDPTQEPSVRELLVAEVDAACRLVRLELERLERLTDQPAPDRTRNCATAIAMTRVMVDEIQLRAAARPIDEAG